MRCLLFALFLAAASASSFRYGSVSWTKGAGNTVHFTIETAWRRSYDGNYKNHNLLEGKYAKGTGTGKDGYPVTGDVIEINGLEWPVFHTAVGHASNTISYLTGTVLAYSAAEDWMLLSSKIKHTYPTPTNKGKAWVSKFTGCCRLSNLKNNKDTPWSLTSTVNLLIGDESPAYRGLPTIYVQKANGKTAEKTVSWYMPATSSNGKKASSWRVATQTEMGGNGATNPITVDAATGKVSLNTKDLAAGLYNAGLIISIGQQTAAVEFLIHLQLDSENNQKSIKMEYASTDSMNNLNSNVKGYTNKQGGLNGHGYPTLPASNVEFTGFAVEWRVAAHTNSAGSRVGFTWGALPSGSALTLIDGTGYSDNKKGGSSEAAMGFKWTPCRNQAGYHYVCMDAVEARTPTANSKTVGSYATTMHCYEIHVKDDTVVGKPQLVGDYSGSTQTEGEENYKAGRYVAYINRPLDIPLKATDANKKDVLTFGQDGSNGGQCSPPGGWPAGASLLPQTGGPGGEASTTFRWVAKKNQGGWEGTVCVKVTDAAGGCSGAGVADKTSKCFNIIVAKCRYGIGKEQMIQEVASVYNTNWVTLFQLNHHVKHPDYLLHSSQRPLWSGHLYKVTVRDNVYDIAKRMGTTEAEIMTLNADVCSKEDIKVNQKLCVHANPCTGYSKGKGPHGSK